MYEYHLLEAGEHDIRLSGQASYMQPVPISVGM